MATRRLPVVRPWALRALAETPGFRGFLGIGLLVSLLMVSSPMLAKAKPEKITIQLKWKHQFQFAGYYAAQHQGYFAAEGLDATLIEGAPNRNAITEVMVGKADYGIGDSALLLAHGQGLPVVVVAAIFQHSPYILLTRESDGLKEPKDFIGRRIMVEFDQGEIQLKAMFLHERIDLSKIQFIRHSWNLRDLAEGKIDAMTAYQTVEPYQLKALGVSPGIVRPGDHGIDFYGDCLFTSESEAQTRPDRVEAVRRAVSKGWEYAMQHPSEVSQWILALPGVRERGIGIGNLEFEAEAMKSLVASDLVPIGHVNQGRWQQTLDVYQRLGILPPSIKLGEFLFEPGQSLSKQTKDRVRLGGWILAGGTLLVLGWVLTLRRRVREGLGALRESEERYKQLVEMAPDAIFIENEGRFDYLNPAAVALFGIQAPEDLMGHSVLEIVQASDQDRIRYRVESFQVTLGVLPRTEITLNRPDGKHIEVEVITTPIRWKGGTAGRVFLKDITAQKEAEAALQASRDTLRGFFDGAPFQMGVTELCADEDVLLVSVNSAAAASMGLTVQQAHGKRISELGLPGSRRGGWVDRYHEAWESRKPVHFEQQVANESDTWWAVALAFIGEGPTGRPRFSYVVEDITKRRQMALALQKSEARYRLISENTRDLICLHEPNGTYLYLSPSVKGILGYEPEELVGTSPFAMFHPDDIEAIRRVHRDQDLTNIRGEVRQYRLRKKDGAYLWVETLTQPLLGPDGEVVQLQTSTRDISARVKAEEELRRQNELFHLVQRATNDAIWDWDLASDQVVRGENIKTMFGYGPNEVIPNIRWWEDGIHPEDRLRVISGIQTVIREGGTAWSEEFRFLRKDGSYALILDRGYVVRDDQGTPLRMIGAVSDITDRIRADEAQAANQAKSVFLATMTHEIRTPMIGMMGMVEILSHTKLDTDQRLALDTIEASSRNLLGIIGDILDFSKIEAGRLELETKVVSLGQLVEEVFSSYSGMALHKGLRATCDIDPALAQAHLADSTRVGEILGNFLSNALKFTHQGFIHLNVVLLTSDATTQTIAFQVKDSGIGVSAENQKRLFQPFVQAESNTTRRFGGTGLGLTISLRLAQLMGGSITMDSKEGAGTTMSFVATFPLADPTSLTKGLESVAWEPTEAPSRSIAEAAGCLVLLVEDHPTNRLVLSRQLVLAGYQADVAEDGPAALVSMGRHHYGLVLTDVQMPGMDGYQLATEIRKIERRTSGSRIPILALTANAIQGELDRCIAAGMDDCIIKPVSIPCLDAKLRQWLPGAAGLTKTKAAAFENQGNQSRSIPSDPPVDLVFLTEFTRGDSAGAMEILRDFRDTTRHDVTELRAALTGGILANVARWAHRIKGSSLMVGAKALGQTAEALERAAGSGEVTKLDPLIITIETAFESLDRFAHEQLAKHKQRESPDV